MRSWCAALELYKLEQVRRLGLVAIEWVTRHGGGAGVQRRSSRSSSRYDEVGGVIDSARCCAAVPLQTHLACRRCSTPARGKEVRGDESQLGNSQGGYAVSSLLRCSASANTSGASKVQHICKGDRGAGRRGSAPDGAGTRTARYVLPDCNTYNTLLSPVQIPLSSFRALCNHFTVMHTKTRTLGIRVHSCGCKG